MIHRTSFHVSGLLVLSLLSAPAAAQSTTGAGSASTTGLEKWVPPPVEFFFDDFEGDTSGWTQGTCTGDCSVEWYFSVDGQCGAIGKMLTFNNPDFFCLYGWVGQTLTGNISSPAFRLGNTPPFQVSFDAIVDTDTSEDSMLIFIEDDPVNPTRSVQIARLRDYAPGLESYSFPVPDSASWAGETAYLRFSAGSDNEDGHESAHGWFVDNLRVHVTGALTAGDCLPALEFQRRVALGSSLHVRLPLRDTEAHAARLLMGLATERVGGDCTPFAGFRRAHSSWVGRSHGPVAHWTVDIPNRPALAGLRLQFQAITSIDGRTVASPVKLARIHRP